jgi:hypothetical protein
MGKTSEKQETWPVVRLFDCSIVRKRRAGLASGVDHIEKALKRNASIIYLRQLTDFTRKYAVFASTPAIFQGGAAPGVGISVRQVLHGDLNPSYSGRKRACS